MISAIDVAFVRFALRNPNISEIRAVASGFAFYGTSICDLEWLLDDAPV